MKRFRTRLLFAFERGAALKGLRVNLGRLGVFVWVKR